MKALALALVLTLFGAAAALADAPRPATVNLAPKNGSGIRAQLSLVDTGRGLVHVLGAARGMDPATAYVTLFYDTTITGGVDACVPILRNPNMLIGRWDVDASGLGFFVGMFAGSFEDVGTLSVRLDPPGNIPGNLQACGRLRVRHA